MLFAGAAARERGFFSRELSWSRVASGAMSRRRLDL